MIETRKEMVARLLERKIPDADIARLAHCSRSYVRTVRARLRPEDCGCVDAHQSNCPATDH